MIRVEYIKPSINPEITAARQTSSCASIWSLSTPTIQMDVLLLYYTQT